MTTNRTEERSDKCAECGAGRWAEIHMTPEACGCNDPSQHHALVPIPAAPSDEPGITWGEENAFRRWFNEQGYINAGETTIANLAKGWHARAHRTPAPVQQIDKGSVLGVRFRRAHLEQSCGCGECVGYDSALLDVAEEIERQQSQIVNGGK